jgi:hypothetical protein
MVSVRPKGRGFDMWLACKAQVEISGGASEPEDITGRAENGIRFDFGQLDLHLCVIALQWLALGVKRACLRGITRLDAVSTQ